MGFSYNTWGGTWGTSWGNSWGAVTAEVVTDQGGRWVKHRAGDELKRGPAFTRRKWEALKEDRVRRAFERASTLKKKTERKELERRVRAVSKAISAAAEYDAATEVMALISSLEAMASAQDLFSTIADIDRQIEISRRMVAELAAEADEDDIEVLLLH